MTDLGQLRRQLDYPDGHLTPLDPNAVVRAARVARHRRRSTVAVVAFVVTAAGGIAVGSSAVSSRTVLGTSPSPEPTFGLPPEMRPASGYLTSAQAARAGLDGRQACTAREVGAVAGVEVTGEPELLGGYLTDTAGLEQWREEFDGGRRVFASAPPPAVHAICWYRGEFSTDSQAEPDGRLEAPYLRIDVPLTGDGLSGTSSQVGRFPIAILAPPLPDPAVLPPELRDATTYVASQPEGVQLLDGDTPPTPHPQPTPAADAIVGDCVPYGCPDASEVPVRIDVTVAGRPAVVTERLDAAPGEVLDVVVTVTAPKAAELTDLRIGVSGEGSDLEEVLVEVAEQGPGAREYPLSWRVEGPAGEQRQLRVEYTATSPLHGDQEMILNRPVVLLRTS